MGVEVITFDNLHQEEGEERILALMRRGLEISSTAVSSPNEQGIFNVLVIMVLKPKVKY